LAAGEGVGRDADGAATYSTPNDEGDQQLYDGENDRRNDGGADVNVGAAGAVTYSALTDAVHELYAGDGGGGDSNRLVDANGAAMYSLLTAHRMKTCNNCTLVKVAKALGVAAAAVAAQCSPTTITPFPVQHPLLSHSQTCSSTNNKCNGL
jgi:hypothetical protein